MRWTHLKPSDGRLMPWKNGGGTTLELAVEPAGSTLETGFAWRLSTAEVGSSGPFSRFPGIQRFLVLLEGAGMSLDFAGRPAVDLLEPLVPVSFSGDWPASATLVGGPCRDFNLMADPSRCSAELRVLHLDRPSWASLPGPSGFLFVARGTLAVPALGCHLGPRHTLKLEEGPGGLQVVPGYGGASVLAATLGPV